jgi:Glycosyl hydrolase family 79 C-terminal beta domain
MNRRDFLANLAAAGAIASRASGQNAESVHVVIRPDRIGAIAPDFMGLGYEISSVARTGLLRFDNHVYIQLVRTLNPRGVIRIGGNTADYAHYNAAGSPVSSAKGTVVNGALLRDLSGFLHATGWKLIWALNLGTGSEAEAIAEAGAMQAAVGSNLLAFEIGNEPDLFGRQKHRKADYSYDDWLADYRRYKKALREQFPKMAFAGPDAAVKTDWVTRFAADEGKDAVLLTHHYYREGQNPASTIEKLLGVDPKLQPQLAQLSAASRNSGLPYRICEVNSFSGGGRAGVSDTMAGALWALDYMFTLAANGCAGVNMETGVNHLDFVSSYSPIGDDEHGHYSAKPESYGMLAFSLGAKSELYAVDMESSPELKAYASKDRLTLINKSSRAVVFAVEGAHGSQGSLIRLSAPSVDAKTGVTLGGAEVSAAGTWKPAKSERVALRHGQCKIELPAASAIVLTFTGAWT